MLCLRSKQDHGFVMYLLTSIILQCISITYGKTYINQFAVHVKDGRHGLDRVLRATGLINKGQIGELEDHYLLEIPSRHRRSTTHSQEHHESLSSHPHVAWFEQQVHKPRYKRDVAPNPHADVLNDKLYGDQWYLHGGGYGNFDMNVIPAWKKGYTGRNVVVSILDDGIERTHPDLQQNYDPFASYDVNDHDNDPMPRYDPSNENRHGTRCAGEVSAVANNTVCGVGIAPNSKIGGVRMLDGEVYDAVEAASLSFNRSHIDIYSASWGPDDDGRVVDGPGNLAKKAFIDGITQGRQGKGSIYVWASGNGGNAQDSCNCDGYTNSIYTLSISSTSEHGRKPWYLEECSSTLATTYSSGAYPEKQIVTVDLRGTCTEGHTGTSASAPLAAGVVALVLEANPSLTWRDVQYITMMTSNPDPMVDGQWTTNSLGRKVSLRYGYGLMDAAAMVDLAEVWTNIPEQHICEVHSSSSNVKLDGSKYLDKIETQACAGLANNIKYLEHVQVKVSLVHKRRGDVILWITSPRGTRSKLLPKRPNDRQQGEFKNWPFLSVHFWGEDPTGSWTLEIDDARSYNPHGSTGGVLRSWSIVLHGTATQPINLTNQTALPTTTTVAPTSPVNATTFSPGPIVCHKECKDGCTGSRPEDCNQCKNVQIVGSGVCSESCPDGYYQTSNMLCQTCDTSCKTCSGPTLSECLTCPPGSYFTEKHHICSKECLKGYYSDVVTSTAKNVSTVQTSTPATSLRNDVRCTKTSIKVFIPLKYAKANYYVLRDPRCGTHNNGTHLLIEFKFGECGTQFEFRNDSLVLSNQLKEISDSDEVISIQCEYPRHQNVSLRNSSDSSASKIFIFEKGRGVGIMTIQQFKTRHFLKPITPSLNEDTVKAGELIYMRIAVEGALSNAVSVGVIVDSCTVDPMSAGEGEKRILLVENNCENIKNGVEKYKSAKQFFEFSFPAPPFSIGGKVQVSCQVSACNKKLDCNPNCNRKRRSIRSESDSVFLRSDPIFVAETSEKYISKEAIATACLSVLSVVLLIAVIVLVKDRHNFNNQAIAKEKEIPQ